MTNAQAKLTEKPGYTPPPIDGDFYRIASVLNNEQRALLGRVRAFTEGVVAPVIELGS
jgi:glutaryl-CoA dehydrogenase